MLSPKKIDLEMDFAAGVYLSEAQNPPLHTVYVYTAHLFTMYLKSLLTLINTRHKIPLQVNFLNDDILLWCLFS
jgi:hypothetical protein